MLGRGDFDIHRRIRNNTHQHEGQLAMKGPAMGERIFRVFLDELTTIRVTCKECERTIECGIASVAEQFKTGQCPFCRKSVLISQDSGDLGQFVLAMGYLQSRAPKLTVEFPVKLPG